MRKLFALSVVLLSLNVATPLAAQQLPEAYYDRWLSSYLAVSPDIEVTASSKVTKDGDQFTYHYRLTNSGSLEVVVLWDHLSKLLAGPFCFEQLIPLAPGETKDFTLKTHLPPMVLVDKGELSILKFLPTKDIEDRMNVQISYEKLGKYTYPATGKLISFEIGGRSSVFLPSEWAICFKDR